LRVARAMSVLAIWRDYAYQDHGWLRYPFPQLWANVVLQAL
jgi:hypothetical protein